MTFSRYEPASVPMNHLDYYRFQAHARGVRGFEDVRNIAADRAHVYDRIARAWLPGDKTLPIAELACGHGSFLHWLKGCGYTNITGVDSSPEQLEFARMVGVSVEEGDVNAWLASQDNNRFATIIAIDLIEHLPKDEFMCLLHQAHAALLPGGALISRLPNGESPFVGKNLFNDVTHVWTYTPNAMNSLALMHGFSTASFRDESADAIRDHRWLKVPLAKMCTLILRAMARMATRETIQYWSPHLWACFRK